MTQDDLKDRTKKYGLRMMKLSDALPKTNSGKVIGNQLLRSGTSVGANYRAACRARSKTEFIAKLGVVAEEADECAFWLELIMEGQLLKLRLIESLYQETKELIAIFTTTLKSAKSKKL